MGKNTARRSNDFRAMMYLGRMGLSDGSRIETMQACLLTRLWAGGTIGASKASDLWAGIYNTTVFFVGQSDNRTFADYAGVLDRVAGTAWRTGKMDAIQTNLGEIMAELQKLPASRIFSGSSGQGLSIMGQRFIPDSHIFGRLVYNNAGTPVEPRLFPRGLDALAVLGSKRARQHLIDLYHDDRYLNYTSALDSPAVQFAAIPESQWTESLYWNWLYTPVPLLQIPGNGYPFFMTTPAWADKSLTSAPGSWAELRHASILLKGN